MSRLYALGPWEPASLLRQAGEAKARLCVWRSQHGVCGEYLGTEYMRDDAEKVLTFATLEEANVAIAIAKAVGSAA